MAQHSKFWLAMAVAVSLVAGGCTASRTVVPPASQLMAERVPSAGAVRPRPHAGGLSGMFVANRSGNTVTQYRSDTTQTSLSQIEAPFKAVFSKDGLVYVAMAQALRVYDAAGTLVRSLNGPVTSVAVDDAGMVFVASPTSVSVYESGAQTLLHGFSTPGNDNALIAVNKSGSIVAVVKKSPRTNLPEQLDEYGSDGTLLVRGIGVGGPIASITFGPSGDVYVASYRGASPGAVKAFKPASYALVRNIPAQLSEYSGIAFDSRGNLYVPETHKNAVTVYAPAGDAPIRTITRGVSAPLGVGLAADDSLYVANSAGRAGTISVYPANAASPWTSVSVPYPENIDVTADGRVSVVSTIEGPSVTLVPSLTPGLIRSVSTGVSAPIALALDRGGNAYVANLNSNSVTVYAPGATTPLRTISASMNYPYALALDSTGVLYVANRNANSVTAYAPGSTTLLRTITDGIKAPRALAIGSNGELFVANADNSVTSYLRASGTLNLRITDGMNGPDALAFDSGGDLFVANGAGDTVTVFAPGSTLFERRITSGISTPVALAFDGSNNLYVANARANSVTEYTTGTTNLMRTIRDGIGSPQAIGVDVRSTHLLFVGDASSDAVTAYDSTSGSPAFRIKQGLGGPAALAFPP